MPRNIIDLRKRDCRFVVGACEETGLALFCAEPMTHYSSFCAEHQALCYVPASRMRTRAPIRLPVDLVEAKKKILPDRQNPFLHTHDVVSYMENPKVRQEIEPQTKHLKAEGE